MRQRKYRIYHKDSGSMEYGFDLVTVSQYLNKYTDEYIEKNIKVTDWTGLKDKLGKEIYEGDIVRTPLYGQRDCEVIFMKAGFYLLLDTGIGTNLYEPSDVSMEIIGNIYEHPNLFTHPERA